MQLNNTKLQEYDFWYNHLCKVFLRHRFYSFILLGHPVHDLSCCITNEIVGFLSYFASLIISNFILVKIYWE